MRQLECAEVRDLLSAYSDGELPGDQHVVVRRHLSGCPECAAEAQAFDSLACSVREVLSARADAATPDLSGLPPGVVSRLQAEDEMSLRGRLGRLLEDMHVVWAVMGATAATLICMLLVHGMLMLAGRERPDSLAAVLSALASSGSNQNPARVGGGVLLPRAYADAVMPAAIASHGHGDEGELAVSTVITREGTVSRVELLASEERSAGPMDDHPHDLDSILDAVAFARFEPARLAGNPVAVNMVWLVAHTTVRGTPHRAAAAPAGAWTAPVVQPAVSPRSHLDPIASPGPPGGGSTFVGVSS